MKRNRIALISMLLGVSLVCSACNPLERIGSIVYEEASPKETESQTDDSGSNSNLSLSKYSDDREDYESDAVFANFRSVSVGNLRKDTLYRSASPCDNTHNRAAYADKLMREAEIAYVLNLSDDETSVEEELGADDFDSSYYQSLYEEDHVLPVAMGVYYGTDEFTEKTKKVCCAIYEHDGPFLIHCVEGRHRTGFLCMILEALAGATYDEIVADYMRTYENYYGITEDGQPELYEQIVASQIDEMIRYMAKVDGKVDLSMLNYSLCARSYLLRAGMSELQIEKLIDKLTYKYADEA